MWLDQLTTPFSPKCASSPSLGSLVGWEGVEMGLLVSLQHHVPMGLSILGPHLSSHPHDPRCRAPCLSFSIRKPGITMGV